MRKTLTSLEGWTRSLKHPLYPDDDVCEEMLCTTQSKEPIPEKMKDGKRGDKPNPATPIEAINQEKT